MQRSSSVEWVGLVLLERVGSLRGKRICAWLRLLMIGGCVFVFFHLLQLTEEKPRVNSNYLLVGFFGITLLRYGGLLLLVLLCVTPSKIDFCLKSKIRFILPESADGPSPCQPCQLLHRCHNQPGMKTKGYFFERKGVCIYLLISEPGSFDSIRADKEARADYNRARRDKRPKVFAHLPAA